VQQVTVNEGGDEGLKGAKGFFGGASGSDRQSKFVKWFYY